MRLRKPFLLAAACSVVASLHAADVAISSPYFWQGTAGGGGDWTSTSQSWQTGVLDPVATFARRDSTNINYTISPANDDVWTLNATPVAYDPSIDGAYFLRFGGLAGGLVRFGSGTVRSGQIFQVSASGYEFQSSALNGAAMQFDRVEILNGVSNTILHNPNSGKIYGSMAAFSGNANIERRGAGYVGTDSVFSGHTSTFEAGMNILEKNPDVHSYLIDPTANNILNSKKVIAGSTLATGTRNKVTIASDNTSTTADWIGDFDVVKNGGGVLRYNGFKGDISSNRFNLWYRQVNSNAGGTTAVPGSFFSRQSDLSQRDVTKMILDPNVPAGQIQTGLGVNNFDFARLSGIAGSVTVNAGTLELGGYLNVWSEAEGTIQSQLYEVPKMTGASSVVLNNGATISFAPTPANQYAKMPWEVTGADSPTKHFNFLNNPKAGLNHDQFTSRVDSGLDNTYRIALHVDAAPVETLEDHIYNVVTNNALGQAQVTPTVVTELAESYASAEVRAASLGSVGILAGKGDFVKTGAGELRILNDAEAGIGHFTAAGGTTVLSSGTGRTLANFQSVSLTGTAGLNNELSRRGRAVDNVDTTPWQDSSGTLFGYQWHPAFFPSLDAATLVISSNQIINNFQTRYALGAASTDGTVESAVANARTLYADEPVVPGTGFGSRIFLGSNSIKLVQSTDAIYRGSIYGAYTTTATGSQGGVYTPIDPDALHQATGTIEKYGPGILVLLLDGATYNQLNIHEGDVISNAQGLGRGSLTSANADYHIVQNNSGTLYASLTLPGTLFIDTTTTINNYGNVMTVGDGAAGHILIGKAQPGVTGNVVVNNGVTLEFNSLAPDAFASAKSITLISDNAKETTLSIQNSTQHLKNLSGAANTRLDLGRGVLYLDESNGATFAGKITGVGSLVKDGAGDLVIDGTKTSYFGATVVKNGRLFTSGPDALKNSSGVVLGETRDANGKVTGSSAWVGNGANQAIGSLYGVAGSVVNLNGGTLTVGQNPVREGLLAQELQGNKPLSADYLGRNPLAVLNDGTPGGATYAVTRFDTTLVGAPPASDPNQLFRAVDTLTAPLAVSAGTSYQYGFILPAAPLPTDLTLSSVNPLVTDSALTFGSRFITNTDITLSRGATLGAGSTYNHLTLDTGFSVGGTFAGSFTVPLNSTVQFGSTAFGNDVTFDRGVVLSASPLKADLTVASPLVLSNAALTTQFTMNAPVTLSGNALIPPPAPADNPNQQRTWRVVTNITLTDAVPGAPTGYSLNSFTANLQLPAVAFPADFSQAVSLRFTIPNGATAPAAITIPAGTTFNGVIPGLVSNSGTAQTIPAGTNIGGLQFVFPANATSVTAGTTYPAGTTIRIAAPDGTNLVVTSALPAGTVLPVGNFIAMVNQNNGIFSALPPGSTMATGSITSTNSPGFRFPDGSILPAGTTINKSDTIPDGSTFGAGSVIPQGAILPTGSYAQALSTIPAGSTLPVGTIVAVNQGTTAVVTVGNYIPAGSKLLNGSILHAGDDLIAGSTIAAGLTLPNGITIPAGSTFSGEFSLPDNTTVVLAGNLPIGTKFPVSVAAATRLLLLNIAGFTQNDAAKLEFAGDITGTGGLIKIGSDDLFLSGVNHYTGATEVRAGRLIVNVNSLPNTSAITVLSGATFGLNADAGVTGTFTQSVSGAGNLDKFGKGTVILGTTLKLTGDVTVRGGTLQLGLTSNDTVARNYVVGDTSLAVTSADSAAARLHFHQDSAATVYGTIRSAHAGDGLIWKSGAATLTVAPSANVSGFTGGYAVTGGTLSMPGLANNAIGVAKSAVFSGVLSGDTVYTRQFTGATETTDATTKEKGVSLSGEAGTISISGTVGTRLSFITAQTGFQNGTLAASGITVDLTDTPGADIFPNSKVSLTSGATLKQSATVNAQSLKGLDGASGTTLDLGANTLALNVAANDAATFRGVISGTGSLHKTGAGKQSLIGTTTSPFSGTVNIDAGELEATPAALGTAAVHVNAPGGVKATFTLRNDDTSAPIAFVNTFDGAGALAKTGLGAVSIGSVSVTGGVSVREGRLITGDALGDSVFQSVAVANGASFLVTMSADRLHDSASVNALVDSGVGAHGSLAVSGSHTLTLAGTQSYHGDTELLSGANLAFQDAAARTLNGLSGDVSTTVTMSGDLAIVQGAHSTYPGSNQAFAGKFIGTASALSIAAPLAGTAGKFIYTGFSGNLGDAANTGLTSVTVSTGGKLQVGAANTKAVTLSGGSLYIDSTGGSTYSADISGAGSVIKTGTGTLSFTGATAFTGALGVDQGVLALNVSGIDSSKTTALRTEGSGTLQLDTTGSSVANPVLLAAPVTGDGFTEITGGGKLKVNDTTTRYFQNTGLTTVTGNTTLGGNFTTAGALTVASGSTLAPGTSPGTVTVNGAFTLASGATLDAEVSATASDKVVVNGAATLSGTIAVKRAVTAGALDPAPLRGKAYSLITATSGVTLANSQLTQSLVGNPSLTVDSELQKLGFTRARLVQVDANSVNLYAVQQLAATPGYAIHDGLGAFVALADAGSLPTQVQVSIDTASAASLTSVVNNLTPLGYAAEYAMAQDGVNRHQALLHDRLEQRRYDRASHLTTEDAPWEAFIVAGSTFVDNADGTSKPTFDYNNFGGLVGLDKKLDDEVVVGGAIAYDNGKATLSQSGGKVDMNRASAVAFISSKLTNRWYLDGGVTAGYGLYESKRNTPLGSVKGDNDGFDAGVFAETGTVFALTKTFHLTPYAGVAYTHHEFGGFSESGVSSALKVDGWSQDSLRAKVGTGFGWFTGPVKFGFDVALAQELFDTESDIDSRFVAGGSRFGTTAAALPGTAVSLTPSVTWSIDESAGVTLGYTYEMGDDSRSYQSLNVAFRKRF